MKFQFAYLKLAFFYTCIVMFISVIFSVVIYSVASNEIEQGLGGQNSIIRGLPGSRILDDLDSLRNQQLEESNSHLRLNLIYYNLLILIVSAALSYFLAKKTLEPIEKSVESQNRFTADASHELKTPLSAMKSEIEVALRDKILPEAEARKLLKSNLEEIDKLSSLSNALLKLARNDETSSSYLHSVDLLTVIEGSIEKAEKIAQLKEIKIGVIVKKHKKNSPNTASDGFIIKGDQESLSELFGIILENAIKYSPKNTKIKITVEKIGKQKIVKILDQGIGMKASDIPHIFERFYRADHSRNKEKYDGYGLGLSIAKQIVNLHKGTISVTSQPGKGSEFKIAF